MTKAYECEVCSGLMAGEPTHLSIQHFKPVTDATIVLYVELSASSEGEGMMDEDKYWFPDVCEVCQTDLLEKLLLERREKI